MAKKPHTELCRLTRHRPTNDRLSIAAAFAIAVSVLGAGYAVGRIGSAALGLAAEKPELLTRSILFVALAEGLAVLGFAIAMMLCRRYRRQPVKFFCLGDADTVAGFRNGGHRGPSGDHRRANSGCGRGDHRQTRLRIISLPKAGRRDQQQLDAMRLSANSRSLSRYPGRKGLCRPQEPAPIRPGGRGMRI